MPAKWVPCHWTGPGNQHGQCVQCHTFTQPFKTGLGRALRRGGGTLGFHLVAFTSPGLWNSLQLSSNDYRHELYDTMGGGLIAQRVLAQACEFLICN